MKAPNINAAVLVLTLILLKAPIVGWSAGLVGEINPKLQDQALLQALKQGGYVVFLRHGITGKQGEKSVSLENIDDCTIQRNLSEEGVLQTKRIGKAIQKNNIPVGTVLSSPYCRCMDTAMNIFGRAQRNDVLFFAINTTKSQRDAITEQLKQLLSTPPPAGVNTFLVSHTANLREAAGIWPKPEGAAYVFKPLGEQGFSYMGAILPEKWGGSGL